MACRIRIGERECAHQGERREAILRREARGERREGKSTREGDSHNPSRNELEAPVGQQSGVWARLAVRLGARRFTLSPLASGLLPRRSALARRDPLPSCLSPLASRRVKSANAGFTLIELIVVFAILALLISVAAPRYFSHIERAKEATLKQDLSVMRDAIDKFYGDKGRYPETLEELAKERYIRDVPTDPFTDSASSWVVLPPADAKEKGQVYDVKSGADGKSSDGKAYSEW